MEGMMAELNPRDWFASQAVVGLLHGFDSERYHTRPFYDQVAEDAYYIADKLMEKREAPEEYPEAPVTGLA